MKDTFVVCTAISIIASFTKIVLDSAFGEKVSRVVQIFLDILLLTIILSAFFGVEYDGYTEPDLYTSINFEMIEKDTLQEIKVKSESMLAEKICSAVENKFNEKPKCCIVVIDIENFELSELSVYFDISKAYLSGYELTRFLKENYNVEAEVVFN